MKLVDGLMRSLSKGVKDELRADLEKQQLLMGRIMSNQVRNMGIVRSLREPEFQVFSQWGDDGIIQYLTGRIDCPRTFIEFGVEDYRESNTRFLMFNDNWTGLVMDGSERHIHQLRSQPYYWRYDLRSKVAFVTRENINELIASEEMQGDIGLLHIDIDGNDYWVWKEISVVDPAIVIMEYNAVFGIERAITIPYRPDFVRDQGHYSCLYAGASLLSLCDLASKKGYSFVGCNSNGNNAYFVRNDKVGRLNTLTPSEGYVESKFREGRDEQGRLTLLSGQKRLEVMRGLPVINTRTGALESI